MTVDITSPEQQITAIDLVALDALQEMLGCEDDDVLDAFLDDTLPDVEGLLGEVEGAVAAQDAERLKIATHTLRANCRTVGAVELGALARELETRAERSELPRPEVQAKVRARLLDAYARFREALARELERRRVAS